MPGLSRPRLDVSHEDATVLPLAAQSQAGSGLRVVPNEPVRVFVGRKDEFRLLRQSLDEHQLGRSAAALIAGEAGIGKTALLEECAATMSRNVRWVRGVESEALLPFAAIADLLGPLRRLFDLVPEIQREALEASLALRSGPAARPLYACAGALTVLEAAGAEQRLLLVVDDLQWVDPASRQILLFVARRIIGGRVAMVFATRDQPGDRTPATGLPTVRLTGMSVRETRDLVENLGIDVSAALLAQIVEQTGGNPLAVIETLRATPAAVLRGCGFGFTGPRLGPALHRVWSAALDTVPEGTQTALFVLAASGRSTLFDLKPIFDALGLQLAVLGPAQREGLLETVSGEIRLRYPLMRPILFERTPFPTHQSVCNALAKHAAHPKSWSRAVQLTVDPSTRAELLLAAAADAHLAGASDVAQDWCNEALALRSDPGFATDVVLVRGRARTWLGHPLWAVDDLVRAGDTVVRRYPVRAARLYAEAALSCAVAGRFDDMVAITARSEAAQRPGVDRPMEATVMSAVALALTGRCADARQRLDQAAGLVVDSRPPWDFQHLIMLGLGRMWMEDFRGARMVLGSVLNAALRANTLAIVPLALAARCALDWWTGHWSSAYTDGVEALQRAEAMGHTPSVGRALFYLARLHAVRGEEALAEQYLHRARREAGTYETDVLPIIVPSVLGLSALTAADHATAADHLDQAWRATLERGLGGTNVVPFGGDLVEAHIRAGDLGRAPEVLAWLDERAAATGLVYPTAAAARCHGLLADDLDSAREWFARAAALHRQVEVPFERARTLLCEGETLRRLRRPVVARPPLLEALAIFESIGARPWAARSEVELAATGVRTRTNSDADRADLTVLTSQERQVAQSVAQGRNNIEVAASLFVSRKTVEAHLTRIYRKLGVRSRTELARLLAVAHGSVT